VKNSFKDSKVYGNIVEGNSFQNIKNMNYYEKKEGSALLSDKDKLVAELESFLLNRSINDKARELATLLKDELRRDDDVINKPLLSDLSRKLNDVFVSATGSATWDGLSKLLSQLY